VVDLDAALGQEFLDLAAPQPEAQISADPPERSHQVDPEADERQRRYKAKAMATSAHATSPLSTCLDVPRQRNSAYVGHRGGLIDVELPSNADVAKQRSKPLGRQVPRDALKNGPHRG
jgi:hypothetical protein